MITRAVGGLTQWIEDPGLFVLRRGRIPAAADESRESYMQDATDKFQIILAAKHLVMNNIRVGRKYFISMFSTKLKFGFLFSSVMLFNSRLYRF